MTWSLYRWEWRLESAVHIGMAPAGSLNRCRLYVPARAVWGAVVAEISRATAGPDYPEYRRVGKELQSRTRFTYLFPAEADEDGSRWRAWLPRYAGQIGLAWRREEVWDNPDQDEIPDRNFRIRALSTRPSTAIDPSSDTAAEGSLRETECINTSWRDHGGPPRGSVGLVGYLFVRADLERDLRSNLEGLQTITIGGDSRYGLGHVRRAGLWRADGVFGCRADLSGEDPRIEAKCVLAHAGLDRNPADLRGAVELLTGWDCGQIWRGPGLAWVPGSGGKTPREWRLDTLGYWVAST